MLPDSRVAARDISGSRHTVAPHEQAVNGGRRRPWDNWQTVLPLPDDAAERFRITLDLHQAGIDLMRQNLRRRNPSESKEQISERVEAWLHTRPGAEHGDAPGRVRQPSTTK